MDDFNYPKTLESCYQLKEKLDDLSDLLYINVNHELFEVFNERKDYLIDWIDEVEFVVTHYVQD